jgi:uncharacterized protein (DUF983 family)
MKIHIVVKHTLNNSLGRLFDGVLRRSDRSFTSGLRRGEICTANFTPFLWMVWVWAIIIFIKLGSDKITCFRYVWKKDQVKMCKLLFWVISLCRKIFFLILTIMTVLGANRGCKMAKKRLIWFFCKNPLKFNCNASPFQKKNHNSAWLKVCREGLQGAL